MIRQSGWHAGCLRHIATKSTKPVQIRSKKKPPDRSYFSRIVCRGWNVKSQSRSVVEDLREELLGTFSVRLIEELFGRQIFDDLTGIHEDDVIGHFFG